MALAIGLRRGYHAADSTDTRRARTPLWLLVCYIGWAAVAGAVQGDIVRGAASIVLSPVLFMQMVVVPLHCAAAQLAARACWFPRRASRRALADVQVPHRRLQLVVVTFLFVACCRGGLHRGEPLAVALLHGSLALVLVAYMGVSVCVVASTAERLHVNEHD